MKNIQTTLNQHIYPVLPLHIARLIMSLPGSQLHKVTEIRIRVNQPLQLVLGNHDITVAEPSQAEGGTQPYRCSGEDLNRTFQLICKNSVYAFEEELRQGYLTINGGHRVGLAGQATTFDGTVKTLKNISSLNIRLAREIPGCADRILPFVKSKEQNEVFSTLIISPPRCGKTTILRDLIRQLSTGNPILGIAGVQIGLVDERSEIAACQNGIPSVDLGPRVDVLDACPKANGLLMLIRSMAPQVVATDELGRAEDAAAVREAVCAGVSVIATAHSRTIDELHSRPYVGELVKENFFERYVILSNRSGPGTVEEIFDSRQGKVIYTCLNEVKVCG
ncbi:stage III sporulation protein AA [Sporomusa sp.]|uniref:stage III sporulation protein AA n=1 Tax=Sporomusa sp. TaxID=2078658 RepID=UPI002C019EC7|nr:stage III sporulation protein AA [Sporomusa sp.]HWR07417.1 stage III sporulation protein AA [Sporomusa sp.]HWR45200.1 stage III sporulation protein AA [Sporomusa sp.]